MLQYHNINGTAYCLYVIAFFVIKALNHTTFPFYEPYRPSEAKIMMSVGIVEVIIKVVLIIFHDYLCSRIIPNVLFGKHILNYKLDFFFKKGPFAIILAVITCSPLIHTILSLLRLPDTK